MTTRNRARSARKLPPPRRIMLVTDVHVPDHDKDAWQLILKLATFEQPHEIVLMGDFAEVATFSQHGKFAAVLENWLTEKTAIRQHLAELRAAAPTSRITYLEGNHETRITRWCQEKAPQLLEDYRLNTQLDLSSLDITWVPENAQPIERGNLRVLHGHQMGTGRGHHLPTSHAKKACEVYGAPGKVIVYGHTHKHQVWENAMYGGNTRAMALGCARDLKAPWLGGSVAGWCLQLAFAYVFDDGFVSLNPVDVYNGRAMWRGELFTSV